MFVDDASSIDGGKLKVKTIKILTSEFLMFLTDFPFFLRNLIIHSQFLYSKI